MKTIIRSLLIGAGATLALGAPAFASQETETYVLENANNVLSALNDPDLSRDERTDQFNEYMDQFTDLNLISNFVIGKYSRRFTDDEKERYRAAFRDYALAVYEVQLDRYRGKEIIVTGSIDDDRGKYSVVESKIVLQDDEELDIKWRLLNRNDTYQVVDVALDLDGNLIWLAIEQRAQFLSLLDQSNGSADALIAKLGDMTAELRAEQAAGVETQLGENDASESEPEVEAETVTPADDETAG